MGRGPRHGHAARLQRLAQHLQRVPAPLGEFVEEQHAVVRQRNFAGSRFGATADQRHCAGGVVGIAERALPPARRIQPAPADRGNGRGFQCLGIAGLRHEEAATAIELQHIARQAAAPAAIAHALGQHPVEQRRTHRRQPDALAVVAPAALLAATRAPLTGPPLRQQGQALVDIAPAVTEALGTEIIGHAAPTDIVKAGLDGGIIPLHIAQRDDEAVGGMRAATQLAAAALLRQDTVAARRMAGVACRQSLTALRTRCWSAGRGNGATCCQSCSQSHNSRLR
mgnify:CR=1 FL=1